MQRLCTAIACDYGGAFGLGLVKRKNYIQKDHSTYSLCDHSKHNIGTPTWYLVAGTALNLHASSKVRESTIPGAREDDSAGKYLPRPRAGTMEEWSPVCTVGDPSFFLFFEAAKQGVGPYTLLSTDLHSYSTV
jgi:hypothetical protein